VAEEKDLHCCAHSNGTDVDELLAAGTFWGSNLPMAAMGQSALPAPLKKTCGSPLLKLAMKRRRPKTFEFLTRQRVPNIDMPLKTRRGGPKSGTI